LVGPFNQRQRQLAAFMAIALLFGANLAMSHGGFDRVREGTPSSPVSHGMLSAVEPPTLHRSNTFLRLGTVGLNLTPCLHASSPNPLTGFTCEHDLYAAYFSAHSNGDHFGSLGHLYRSYFERQYDEQPEYYEALGLRSAEELMFQVLEDRGVTRENIDAVCSAKKQVLENARDLPVVSYTTPEGERKSVDLKSLPLSKQILASSQCRYQPFFEDEPGWGEADYHEQDPHRRGVNATGAAIGDTSTAVDFTGSVEGHGHLGPHGLDFNTELNWIYTALSHQGKVAIVNLNVVDWGKVASYEERTGYRVLLLDDNAVFSREAVLYYASSLLLGAREVEDRFARSLDTIHRYCFDRAAGARWSDRLDTSFLWDKDLNDALAYITARTDPPVVSNPPPPGATGWACFLAFTGIDARLWHDAEFANEFCAYDTRRLARYDAIHSPGLYSRSNPSRLGDGDGWRCDWFIRYLEVTSDIEVKIRRRIDTNNLVPYPVLRDEHRKHVAEADAELDAWERYIEIVGNVSVGPHDVVYNPVTGLVYVTHYWQLNDPDVRMLADWTIHFIDGNPASAKFNNPYLTKGGPGPESCAATKRDAACPGGRGEVLLASKAYPMDVGGPVDGMHPISVDVDVRDGSVFVVNRESNTLSLLLHNGKRGFSTDKASVQLKGPTVQAVTLDASSLHAVPRDLTLYHDPDSTRLPEGNEIGGWFEFNAPAATRAGDDRLGFVSPLVESMTRRILEDTTWADLVQDFRDLFLVEPASFPAAADAFRDRWFDRLTSRDDLAFLEKSLATIERVTPPERPPAVVEVFASLEARWPGRTEAFVADLVDLAEEDHSFTNASAKFLEKWLGAARDGSLVGLEDGTVDTPTLEASVRSMIPIAGAGSAVGTATWLDYCVRYSADDWLFHLAEGEDPWEARGKEKEAGGKHPWHCDDVEPIHYPRATPIQVDYAGVSNEHHVFIIREPVGPLLLDYWYEVRPRLLQPFDIWINPGDGNIYISNLGNHDNAPLVPGWLSIIQRSGGSVPCHKEMSKKNDLPIIGKPADKVPRTTCVVPPMVTTGFQANLLLSMDFMPHHLNVNPYTFEVYGGHLLSDFVMAAQLEENRIDWAIPEAHVIGRDLVPNAAAVPNPNPTGFAVNPASQRLFTTHFMEHHPVLNPLTGRLEDIARYTSVIDLRNYTLVPDLVLAGDHHAVADQIKPPGRGLYEQPFYNRSQTWNVNGRAITGVPVMTGDSGESVNIFWRCTYYRAVYDITKIDKPEEAVVAGDFDSGRCYNIFDLEPSVDDVPEAVSPWGEKAYRDNDESGLSAPSREEVYWEIGFEHLNFGMIHLFIDPDNVPAGLRVTAPHARVESRDVSAGLQATEELASAWVEVDTPARARIPQGALRIGPASGAALAADPNPGDEWFLAFEAAWQVERAPQTAPLDPDRMTVSIGPPFETLARAATWSSSNAIGDAWFESRVPLSAFTKGGDKATVAFDFDSVDAIDNRHGGWSIVQVRVENKTPVGDPIVYAAVPASLPGFASSGMLATVDVIDPAAGAAPVPALAFRNATKGTYEAAGPARGAFSFEVDVPFEDPVLVIRHRQDVEPAGRGRVAHAPVDRLSVEASLDGGVTWRTVWMRDSRDPSQPVPSAVLANVSGLVDVATGRAAASFGGTANPRDVVFRFAFDAIDPVANGYPGWRIEYPRLLKVARANGTLLATSEVALGTPAGLPTVPGVNPAWWRDGAGFRFSNDVGTYAYPDAAGGIAGLACRLDHRGFGTWSGRFLRPPGGHGLSFVGRDLAGHVTEHRQTDGRGPAIVEDTFMDPGFTESYWERREIDPMGLAYPAYVFDPMADGMGDVIPKDTPVNFTIGRVDAILDPAPGEVHVGSRAVLIEVPPGSANWFTFNKQDLVTEAAALVTDGIQRRRALVVTPADSDLERLPEDLRRVLREEGQWLNVSHVSRLREPTPVLTTLDQITQNAQGGPMDEDGVSIEEELIIREFLRASTMALQRGQFGFREPPVDRYLVEGTPALRQIAGERLIHRFRFERDHAAPTSVDLAFDFAVRNRVESYQVLMDPQLPRVDLELLRYILNNVTLDKLDLAESEIRKLVGDENLTGAFASDVRWLREHTLADLGYTLEDLLDTTLEAASKLLSVRVPMSEILNDLDRLQMSLPTFGQGHRVRVWLVNETGGRALVATRDAIDGPVLPFEPEPPAGDVRVTLAASKAPGFFDVKVGLDVARFEKLRVTLDAAEAERLLPETGDYAIEIEAVLKAGDAPVPGLVYEMDYGPFWFNVGRAAGANEAPDATFVWVGPVEPGRPVVFAPNRATPALANLEDPDGRVVSYRWTLPVPDASLVSLGAPLAPDANDDPADDFFTNALATGFGRNLRRLTVEETADGIVVAYEADGCFTPSVTATFPSAGAHVVKLEVTDDGGRVATRQETVVVGASRRAPELLVDPWVEDGAGPQRVAWQADTGALVLSARGRTLDLDLSDPTPEMLAILENAAKTSREVIEAVKTDPLSIPDILLDSLVVRPATVRVVTTESQDASAGVRMQIRLGAMPESLDVLRDSLASAKAVGTGADRFARTSATNRTIVVRNLADLTEDAFAEVTKLLHAGLLEAYVFTYALHPEKADGSADLSKTLARMTFMDTGAGVVFLVGYEVVDDVETIVDFEGSEEERELREALARLDAIVPFGRYLVAAKHLEREGEDLARALPLVTALEKDVASIIGEPTLFRGLETAFGASKAQVVARGQRIAAVDLTLNAITAEARLHVEEVSDAALALADARRAEIARWAGNAMTNVTLDSVAEREAAYRLHVQSQRDAALAEVAAADENGKLAVAELLAANDALLAWAEDWVDAIERRDVRELDERVMSARRNATLAMRELLNATAAAYERVDPKRFIAVFDGSVSGLRLGAPSQSQVVLGYDASTRAAFVRVGDRILDEGTVNLPPAQRVHASMTFTSIGAHSAEIDAIWGGRGGTLIDGFNGVMKPMWSVVTTDHPGTRASAAAEPRDATRPSASVHTTWVTRSPEGLASDALEAFVNRRRAAEDARASLPDASAARRPDAFHRATDTARTLDQVPEAVALRADHPEVHLATVDLAPGAVQEISVSAGGAKGAPTVGPPLGAPPAPFVFDARLHRAPGLAEKLQVSFQPSGLANPAVAYYEVFASPRPDGKAVKLGHVTPGYRALEGPIGEADWRPGVDFVTFETSTLDPAFDREWRYITVRGVNKDGLAGESSLPYRVRPALLEERFALHREGRLAPSTGVEPVYESGEIRLDPWGLVDARLDTCLGDMVEITRETSFPHDAHQARWSRALRIQERGLDTLFSILNQLNRDLDAVPMNLASIDQPLASVDLDLCPSVEKLAQQLNGLATETILQALAIGETDPSLPPLRVNPPVGSGNAEVNLAFHDALAGLLADRRIDLSIEDILHGTPATVTWRTAEVTGPYHARVRFLVPGLQPGLFNALIPGDRFHLVQLGRATGGAFEETLRVDLDPHILAPLDPEGAVSWVSALPDPVGAVVGNKLPLSYGIAAGDTATNREIVGGAHPDRWHTIDVYAPAKDADVYAVALDGQFVGQFRTTSGAVPNALRIGGTHIPIEVLVDDIRFGDAIKPPAPVLEAVKVPENHDFATVRWYMPEDGGAPLVDFNLLRRDLDANASAEIVATTAAGHLRALSDPTSHGLPVGTRLAYAVQGVNALGPGLDQVGPPSDARAVVMPAMIPVAADASIAHRHGSPSEDRRVFEGAPTLQVGGAGGTVWRSVLKVNASSIADARGRAIAPSEMGAATFLVYATQNGEAVSSAISRPPTLEELLMTLGYSENLAESAFDTIEIETAEEASYWADKLVPGGGSYVREVFGNEAYDAFLHAFIGTFVVPAIPCPDDLIQGATGLGAACTPADPEPLHFDLGCKDVSRDLELQETAFNCAENAIGAYVSGSTGFDTRHLSWANQPRTEYWRGDDGIDRQGTRSETWRRYDLLPALRRDGDGDLAVTLRKQAEHVPSGAAVYAAREARTWLDDALGVEGRGPGARMLPWADGRGPDAFPWAAPASSGVRSVKLGGIGDIASLGFAPDGVATVPFDAPIKMDVFIPEGEAPRQIGLKISGSVVTRAEGTAGRSCGVYGRYDGPALVTWGDELVVLDPATGALTLDHDGELDHGANLLHPRENFTGLHAGGVPLQRGRWVTLTFDTGQLALEVAAQRFQRDRSIVERVLDALETFRGPDTSLWLPRHLGDARAIYERLRPVTFTERVDSVGGFRHKDIVDKEPYDYHIPSWVFLFQNYDKFILPWHCGLAITSIEVFAVGGTVYVDRLGPDIAPRLRVDAVLDRPDPIFGGGSS